MLGFKTRAGEIIVKTKGRKVEGEHRTSDFYAEMLSQWLSPRPDAC